MRLRNLILAALLLWPASVSAQFTRIPSVMLGTTAADCRFQAKNVADDNPNGDELGSICDTIWEVSSGIIWTKTSGTATNTGWVLVGSGGGAPTSASYLTQTADGTLSAEQAMGALATGIVKNTTTTGVQSIAAAGTDYVAPGAITTSGLTQATARILGRTTASTGAVEELTSVPATLGGTGLTALPTDDQLLVSNGSVNQPKTLPDCDNATTSKLLYDQATNVWSCGSDQDNGAAASFYQTVQEEGSGLTQRATLNFIGAGVSCVDNATKTDCTIGGGSGAVVQVKNTQTGAVATGSTVIPVDDTIPQNTEGDEYMTLAITPTSATNKLRIEVEFFGTSDGSTKWMVVALFQDSTANALATMAGFTETATAGAPIRVSHYMTSGTTSATTFKVRAGQNAAATTTFNGQASGRLFGGVLASSITITEIVP